MRDCQKTKNEDKVAIFKKGDAAWRESRGGRSTARQAPAQGTTARNNDKKIAAANPEDGFINVDAASDHVSQVSQTSFAQFQRYEAFLATNKTIDLEDLEAFGIMAIDNRVEGQRKDTKQAVNTHLRALYTVNVR